MAVKELSKRTKQEMAVGAYRVFRNAIHDSKDLARLQRDQTMERWLKEGKVHFVPQFTEGGNLQLEFILVQVGKYGFRERIDVYPSERLVAEVGLAIHAGVADHQTMGPENG